MRRLIVNWLWLLIFAGLAVGFVIGGWSSKDIPPHQQNDRADSASDSANKQPSLVAQLHSEQKDKEDRPIQSWLAVFLELKLTDAIIAVFTVILAIKTSGLFVETAGLRSAADKQAGDMKESIAAAQRAAEAAQLSAKAAVSVEIPHVYIDNLEFQESGVGNLAAQLQFPHVAISVKNYGRTPAFLGQLAAEMLIAPMLPDAPDYSNTARDLPTGTVIEGSTSYDLPTARLFNAVPIETIKDIIAERTYVWIYGYIFYRDFLRNPHCLRFCAQLIVLNGDGHTGNVHIIESGEDTEYTESY
jgi:hypothetical protein